MTNKRYFQQLLSEGRTQKLVKEMLGSAYFKESDDYSDILHQSARLSTIEQNRNKGVINDAQYFLELNRISAALNALVSNMPDDLELLSVTKDSPVHISLISGKLPVILLIFSLVAITALVFVVPKRVQKTFQLAINVETVLPSSNYPTLDEASLSLWDGTQYIKASIQKDGVADFKGINTDLIGKITKMKMQTEFWKLASDSILLLEKNVVVTVIPNGSLGFVRGEVKDAVSKKALEGVELSLIAKGAKAFTDKDGRFELLIPLEKQEEVYQIMVTKKGYLKYESFVNPQQANIDIPLDRK
jgi:Effector-associated domain 11